MAIDFTPNENLVATSSIPDLGTAFTLSAWFNLDNVTSNHVLFAFNEITSNLFFVALEARGDVAGDPLEFNYDSGTGAVRDRTTTGYSANVWHHACGIQNATNDHDVYLDAGGLTSNTTDTRDPFNVGGFDEINIGKWEGDAGNFGYVDGSVAEVAGWNVALTLPEVESLAAGFSPLFIRPQNLQLYVPLIRRKDSPISAISFSDEGTPDFAPHPRIYYPTGYQIAPFGAAAAPAETTRTPRLTLLGVG